MPIATRRATTRTAATTTEAKHMPMLKRPACAEGPNPKKKKEAPSLVEANDNQIILGVWHDVKERHTPAEYRKTREQTRGLPSPSPEEQDPQ